MSREVSAARLQPDRDGPFAGGHRAPAEADRFVAERVGVRAGGDRDARARFGRVVVGRTVRREVIEAVAVRQRRRGHSSPGAGFSATTGCAAGRHAFAVATRRTRAFQHCAIIAIGVGFGGFDDATVVARDGGFDVLSGGLLGERGGRRGDHQQQCGIQLGAWHRASRDRGG